MSRMRIELVRGAIVESVHEVHVAVVDAEGRLRASAGDPGHTTFLRSAAKPLQAVPIVADGAYQRFGLTRAELALICGSHSGEPRHVRTAQSILRKAGAGPEMLACGSHAPWHRHTREALRERGVEPGRLHNNCSGKHAGMLALARAAGWPSEGYQRAEHPVQARLLREVERWTGRPQAGIALGQDGCGVVCFGLPVREMAFAFARLGSAAREGNPAAAEVVAAMTEHPEMVAGEGRLCTDLMRQVRGRLFAKLGAEGIYCVGVPGAELGIALKVADGNRRAVGAAILSVLAALDLLSDEDLGALERHAFPDVVDTNGVPVGQLRPVPELSVPDA